MHCISPILVLSMFFLITGSIRQGSSTPEDRAGRQWQLISRLFLFAFLIVFMAGWSYLLCTLDHECRPFDDLTNWTMPITNVTAAALSNDSNKTAGKNATSILNPPMTSTVDWYLVFCICICKYFHKATAVASLSILLRNIIIYLYQKTNFIFNNSDLKCYMNRWINSSRSFWCLRMIKVTSNKELCVLMVFPFQFMNMMSRIYFTQLFKYHKIQQIF